MTSTFEWQNIVFYTRKIKLISSTHLVNCFFFYVDRLTICKKERENAGNNVIDIFTCKDMENIPFEVRM